jgi:hypothetical protein
MSPSASTDFFRASRKTNGIGVQVGDEVQICVVMVGLPARGKSLIAQKGTWEDQDNKIGDETNNRQWSGIWAGFQ